MVETLIPGPAPIVDFDGTVALLDVDWQGLRSRFSVTRIEDLWNDDEPGRWNAVTEAEVAAAVVAEPVPPMLAALTGASGFAVLTSNSERSVERFLRRHPALAARARLVIGREALGGPKTDPGRFRAGFQACRDATAPDRGQCPVVYVGDQDYELALATALGAMALHVRDLR